MKSLRRPPIVGRFLAEEVALASRNSGMPLEALRYDVTPVGLHYLLIHFDIPAVEAAQWTLPILGCVWLICRRYRNGPCVSRSNVQAMVERS
jgi:hypothetical protein